MPKPFHKCHLLFHKKHKRSEKCYCWKILLKLHMHTSFLKSSRSSAEKSCSVKTFMATSCLKRGLSIFSWSYEIIFRIKTWPNKSFFWPTEPCHRPWYTVPHEPEMKH
jgi:hypothetical protein